MIRRVLIAVLIVAAAVALADVEVVLKDGKVLQGASVSRDGNEYLIELVSGDVVSVPAELVEQVRLTGAPKPEPVAPPSGLRTGAPQTLAGPPVPIGEDKKAPSGMRTGEPRVLAGVAVEAPRTSDQLAALGPPAQFQKGIVDSTWHMENDWPPDYENNNFAPSKWADSIVDSSWEPESAFDPNEDALAASRSSFSKGIVDSSWQPQDAWGKSDD